jgi:lipopolysaccharide export LptBFGC system permease protein LptF
MTITVAHLQPAISLLAGILILIMPRLLNYIVAIYLFLAGLLGLGLLR